MLQEYHAKCAAPGKANSDIETRFELLEDAISFIGAFYGVIAELLPAVAQLYLNYISCRISGHNDQSMDVYICSESCILVISIGDCFQNHR